MGSSTIKCATVRACRTTYQRIRHLRNSGRILKRIKYVDKSNCIALGLHLCCQGNRIFDSIGSVVNERSIHSGTGIAMDKDVDTGKKSMKVVVRNTTDLQRLKLRKLMKNPVSIAYS